MRRSSTSRGLGSSSLQALRNSRSLSFAADGGGAGGCGGAGAQQKQQLQVNRHVWNPHELIKKAFCLLSLWLNMG